MTSPCEQTGRVSVLEANQAHIMRELGELKEDTKQIKKGISELTATVQAFQQTADLKYVTRKEFEESNRITWLLKVVFGSTAGLAVLASFLKYVLKVF